jgi:hypothetical protein
MIAPKLVIIHLFFMSVVCAVLFALYFIRTEEPSAVWLTVLASASVINGAAAVWQLRERKKNPEAAKWDKIEAHDERNIAILGRAALVTFFLSFFFMSAMLIVLGLANLEPPLYITLGSVAVFNITVFIAASTYYDKKM